MTREKKTRQGFLGADALSVLCYQLSLFLKAGIGLEEGLGLLVQDAPDGKASAVVAQLCRALAAGESFSVALERQGSFPVYMVHMIEIGQISGRLEQVLDALYRYYRRQGELNFAVRRAVFYPAVMSVLVCSLFLVLIARVLPVFQQTLAQTGVSLSPLAHGFLRTGEYGKYLAGGLAVMLALGAAILLLWSHYKGKRGQVLGSSLLSRGAVGLAVKRSRFTNAMALMLSSGLPLDEAVERAGKLLDGTDTSPLVAQCHAQMEAGISFAKTMGNSGLLDGMQSALLDAGFRTGNPERAMEEVASRCQEDADERITQIITRTEFALVAGLCLSVGIVLLSVMLPLLGILSAIG